MTPRNTQNFAADEWIMDAAKHDIALECLEHVVCLNRNNSSIKRSTNEQRSLDLAQKARDTLKQTVMHVQQEAISQKQVEFRFRKDIQSERGWRCELLRMRSPGMKGICANSPLWAALIRSVARASSRLSSRRDIVLNVKRIN